MSITHTTVAVGTDSGTGEIHKAQWNEAHTGGLAQSFAGYNTIGGSWETLTSNRHYYKTITLAAAATFTSIDVHLRPSTDNTDGFIVEIADDNSGAPGKILAANVIPSTGLYLSNSSSMPGTGRWVSLAIGASLASGTYWIGFGSSSTRFDVAYDSGSDKIFTASVYTATGGYPTAWAITDSTRKYSVRASILSG